MNWTVLVMCHLLPNLWAGLMYLNRKKIRKEKTVDGYGGMDTEYSQKRVKEVKTPDGLRSRRIWKFVIKHDSFLKLNVKSDIAFFFSFFFPEAGKQLRGLFSFLLVVLLLTIIQDNLVFISPNTNYLLIQNLTTITWGEK